MSFVRGCTLFLLAMGITALLSVPVRAASVERGPSGCPPMVDMNRAEVAKKWVCFTVKEEGKRQVLEARTLEELDIFRLKKPRRFGRFWTNVGIEYLPNVTQDPYVGYAIGGIAFGNVNIWAGTFGSDPAIGVGIDILPFFVD